MKKLNLLLSVLLMGSLFTSCGSDQKPMEETTTDPMAMESTYSVNLDTAFSYVIYGGTMVGVYTHTGKLAFQQGELSVKGNEVTGGSFTVDMTNMYPTDDNYDAKKGKTREKLVGHLSSADFFDVQNFPTASFTITSVNGNEATGILTVRGKGNEETVKNIVVSHDGDMVKATGELTFDRKKYDVMFDLAVQEMVISNDVKLDIVITGSKKN
jgi:polyisoprenoid-binding protein YceI